MYSVSIEPCELGGTWFAVVAADNLPIAFFFEEKDAIEYSEWRNK